MQLTQSQEDYLETIYVLKSQQDHVRAIDVAREFDTPFHN